MEAILEAYQLTPINQEIVVPFILENCQQWFQEIYGHKIKTNSELNEILSNK